MPRLLLLGCSQRKRADSAPLAALGRYDGPAYRVVRGFLRQPDADAPEIWVLSAAYGLLPATQLLPDYDQMMTPARAAELAAPTRARLRELHVANHYDAVCVHAGRRYHAALAPLDMFPGARLSVSSGRIGEQLAQLRDWLYGAQRAASPLPTAVRRPTTRRLSSAAPRLRGVPVTLDSAAIHAIARQALAAGVGQPDDWHAWHVEIDGRRVAPKWLASQLTGLPVSAFVTTEARRLLEQLGLEVRRTGNGGMRLSPEE